MPSSPAPPSPPPRRDAAVRACQGAAGAASAKEAHMHASLPCTHKRRYFAWTLAGSAMERRQWPNHRSEHRWGHAKYTYGWHLTSVKVFRKAAAGIGSGRFDHRGMSAVTCESADWQLAAALNRRIANSAVGEDAGKYGSISRSDLFRSRSTTSPGHFMV